MVPSRSVGIDTKLTGIENSSATAEARTTPTSALGTTRSELGRSWSHATIVPTASRPTTAVAAAGPPSEHEPVAGQEPPQPQ